MKVNVMLINFSYMVGGVTQQEYYWTGFQLLTKWDICVTILAC